MSSDPVRCHIAGCPGRVLYIRIGCTMRKIYTRGYCAQHRPAGNWIDEVAVIARIVRKDDESIELEPVVPTEPHEEN